MTKLEAVLREWNELKTKFSQLKAKSIDNYLIMNKRTLLGLHNSRLNQPPVELYDILVEGGIVTKKKKTNLKSNRVVNIHTELLLEALGTTCRRKIRRPLPKLSLMWTDINQH